MKNKKGSRSENFSADEIEILINEMEKYHELASGQFSARFPTKKELTEQWKDVAQKLSASNFGILRTHVQVRNKWNDLKYRVKQKAHKYTEHICKTGGGEGKPVPYTDTDLRIIELIEKRCIEGITDDSCDTSTFTLKNLKKANLTHLPIKDEVEDIVSENNADDSDFMTHLPIKDEVDDIISENNADDSDFTTHLPTNDGMNDIISEINADDKDFTAVESASSVVAEPFPVTDQEDVQVITDSASTMPKTSWPLTKSNNRSTIRGQKFRAKKRKRAETELEKFELEALNMQRSMSQQLEKLTDVASAQQEFLRNMCQQLEILTNAVSAQQDILRSINVNVELLVQKMDQNTKLLALNLNDEDLAYQ